jgi:predicted nucleic acid-binding protein
VIVVDASAAVMGLLNDGDARASMAQDAIVCPHLVDAEVVHALRSQVRRGQVEAAHALGAINTWARLGIQRVGVSGLLVRMWGAPREPDRL